MNNEDKQMIAELKQNLMNALPVKKDVEAAALIKQEIPQTEETHYLFVQTLLLQQCALRQMKQQLDEQQMELGQLKKPLHQGVFSRLFGGSNSHHSREAPTYKVPSASQQQPSFLQSAMTTATGVAGGMFLFEGIKHLFGGTHTAGTTSGQFPGLFADSQDSLLNQQSFLEQGFGGSENDFSQNSGLSNNEINNDSFFSDGGGFGGDDW